MKIGYLGIDVSKGYSDFVLLNKKKEELEPCFQLDDNQEGHFQLLQLLKKLSEKHNLTGIEAVMESTGGYENNWLCLLKNKGMTLNVRAARVNPYGVKHDSEAGMVRTETDPTSAKRIAIYTINHPEKLQYEKPGYSKMDSLRSMYNYIGTKTKQKVQLSNQLEKLLYSAFPEVLKYMREQLPKWFLLFLEKYPTALAAKEASIMDFQSISHIGPAKAEKLYSMAQKSVSYIDEPALREIISGYARDLIVLKKQIDDLKKSLEKQVDLPLAITILMSFPGIAIYSATGIMIEIENIDRFPTCKQMCSFFGSHPKFKKSGDKTSKIQMSKHGSPEMRGILFMVAKNALIYDAHMRAIYDRFRAKGMEYKQAMGVIMHKILRIIYGMLKNMSEYNPEYDRNKQQRTAEYDKGTKQCETEDLKKRRRFISKNEEAPISQRQYNKRKEQLPSPNLIGEMNTGYETDCP